MSGIQNNQEHVRNRRNRNRGRGRQSNNHAGATSMYTTGNNAGNNSAHGMQTYSNDARVHDGYNAMGNNINRHSSIPAAFNNAGGYGMYAHGSNMPANSGSSTAPGNMNSSRNAYGGSNGSTVRNAGYDIATNAAVARTHASTDATGNSTSSPAMTQMQRRQTLRDDSVQDISPAAASDAAARAITTAGSITISITAERERPGTNVATPAFLHGFVVTAANYSLWSNVVLPHITLLTFEVSSSSDLHFLANMLSSRQLPLLHQAVTHVTFPGFYWFSGVAHNRRENPYFVLTKTLSGLQTISLRFHTAGITTSRFGERQMLQIEETDPERARERKVMSLDDVVRKYELGGIFACPQLRRVRVEFIDCPRTRFFTRVGDPMDLLREVQMFLVTGFAQAGLNVVVEMEQVQ